MKPNRFTPFPTSKPFSPTVILITALTIVVVAVAFSNADERRVEPARIPEWTLQHPAKVAIPTAFQSKWLSINGGGATVTASTNYLTGTSFGQSVAGRCSSSTYKTGIGFWYGPVPQSLMMPISITPTVDTSLLRSQLVINGTGITITSATFSGASTAAGTYTSGPFGIQDGVILATGDVTNALPPNNSGSTTTDFGQAGCSECDSLSNGTSFDAAILTLTFNVSDTTKSMSFDFIFGSEEYPEYVGSQFNDVFAAYLNGNQIIYDDSGRTMTINGYFLTGGFVVTPPDNGLEYDGSSPNLRTVAPVTRGSTGNVLKFVICDVGDRLWDSGTLLASLRGKRDSTGGVTGIPPFPVFDTPPSPNCDTTLNVIAGNTVNFTVQASDSIPSHTVRLTTTGLPVSAVMTPPLPYFNNPVSSNFSWTPTNSQVGTYALTFIAKDTVGLGQTSCSYTINVLCSNAKGDMNGVGGLTPADVVLMLNCVYLASGNCDLCFADVNCVGGLTPADVVIELQMVYLARPPGC